MIGHYLSSNNEMCYSTKIQIFSRTTQRQYFISAMPSSVQHRMSCSERELQWAWEHSYRVSPCAWLLPRQLRRARTRTLHSLQDFEIKLRREASKFGTRRLSGSVLANGISHVIAEQCIYDIYLKGIYETSFVLSLSMGNRCVRLAGFEGRRRGGKGFFLNMRRQY